MKAAMNSQIAQPLTARQVPDPTPPDHGVVIRVKATVNELEILGSHLIKCPD